MNLVEDMKHMMDQAEQNYLKACELELVNNLKTKVLVFFQSNPNILTFQMGVHFEYYSGPTVEVESCHLQGVVEAYNTMPMKDRFNFEKVSNAFDLDKPDELTTVQDLGFYVYSHHADVTDLNQGKELEPWVESHHKGFKHIFKLSDTVYYSGIYFWRENTDDDIKIEIKQSTEEDDLNKV